MKNISKVSKLQVLLKIVKIRDNEVKLNTNTEQMFAYLFYLWYNYHRGEING